MLSFNINDDVYVKLTDLGRKIHRQNFDAIMAGSNFQYFPPNEDEDGWSKWQLWDLMSQFGSHISMGFKMIPFETTIKLNKEEHNDS